MARNPKTGRPWYRKDREAWYVQHKGKQVKLAEGKANKAEAFAVFARLLTETDAEPAGEVFTVGQAIDDYRAWVQDRVAASTAKTYGYWGEKIKSSFGESPAGGVSPIKIQEYARVQDWSPASKGQFVLMFKLALGYCSKSGKISKNPLGDTKVRTLYTRGGTSVISPEVHDKLMVEAYPELQDLLFILRETGCRVREALRVRAQDVDWDRKCWVLQEHKTVRKTGKPRVVFLTDSALDLCRRRAQGSEEGPLFTTSKRTRWTTSLISGVLGRLCARVGVPRIKAVGYRHTFATDGLAKGLSPAIVAHLLGHSSPAMVTQIYGHLDQRGAEVREFLSQVRPPEGK